MRITVVIDPTSARRWHLRMSDELRRDGHAVSVLLRRGPDRDQRARRALDRLLALERHLYPIDAENPSRPLDPAAVAACGPGDGMDSADCCIDFAQSGLRSASLVPVFDGSADDIAAAAALLEGRAPSLGVARHRAGGEQDDVVAAARPAVENRTILSRALDQVFVGMTRLLLQTVRRIERGDALADTGEGGQSPPAQPASRAMAAFALASLTDKIASRLTRLVSRPEHWSIGWRRVRGDAVRERLAWPASDYRFLPDDGTRYYADPFVFMHEGIVHVFCEEYPYATGRGIIAHFTIAPDGAVTVPRCVLEAPYHLSYPFVFAERGEIWMIPETSGNRTVELFRAQRFPDRWTREAVLLENVVAGDATLTTHAGRRWLFATLAGDGGSSWDALGLFHAADLFGAWQAHPLNPVLIDVRAARPAGEMFLRDGRLFRPAQDCSSGYGSALTICEVTRLDPEAYAQSVVARLEPPAGWRADGVHTLNEAGGVEVIDRVGRRRRF